MYLEKLVITGFKSFPQTTEFTFEHPFVAIVGPNGSGKTNVTDALRWVMGEQALKLLRVKHATDVIFAGSEQLSRSGLARVDLYLNNAQKRLPIDYTNVVISRQITRAGETEYLLNNTPARLQDILLLLAQANFGQKSYGVIGQGQITDIINANPQDRKMYFDEATGIKEFQIKRDQAIHKLIRTEENLLRVEDLLNEIEPRLKSLNRQVKKLEQRHALEAELHTIQTQYYGSSLLDLRRQVETQQGKAQTLEADRVIAAQQLADLEQRMDTLQRETSRTALYQQLQHDYDQVITQKNALLKEQAILQGRLELEQEQHGEIELIWLERRATDVQQQLQNTQATHQQLVATLAHQEMQLQTITTAQVQVKQDVQKVEQELDLAKIALTKAVTTVSLQEIKERLTNLFQRQEQFLRSLLNTTSLAEFKDRQQQAQTITTALASLLDDLHEEDREAVALQQQAIQALTNRLTVTLELKDKLLQDYAELKALVQTRHEQLATTQQTVKQLQVDYDRVQTELKSKQTSIQKNETRAVQLQQLQAQSETLVKQLGELDIVVQRKQQALTDFNQTEEAKQQRLLEQQTQARQIQIHLNQLANEAQAVAVRLTKLQTRQEDLQQEISREVPEVVGVAINQWTETRSDHDKLLIDIERIKHQLELVGGIDPDIVQEQQQTEERFSFLKQQAHDLRQAMTALERVIDELDGTIKHQFNQSFQAITKNFAKYFKLLFVGGEAKLQLMTEQPAAPAEEVASEPGRDVINHVSTMGKRKLKQRVISGIEIIAQPPGKKLNSIQVLSGGEKSLTAIALMCAIIDANTPPFVVLDEVEAALDESNTEKFSAIIKQLSKKTQFIVISHNHVTMRQADVLYGVTMNKAGVSKILSVKLAEAEQMIE